MRYAHKTPSRRKVALGGIRGRIFSWGVLLPLMVRSNGSRNLKLNPRLVGTNVQNWASALQFSSLQSRFPAHLADFSRYVEPAPPQESLYTLLPKRSQSRRWIGLVGNPVGRGFLFWKVSRRWWQGPCPSGSFRTSLTARNSSLTLSEVLSSVDCRPMINTARWEKNSKRSTSCRASLTGRPTSRVSKISLSQPLRMIKYSLLVLMSAGSGVPLYAFSLFLPTIINQVSDDVTNPRPRSMLTSSGRSGTVPPPPTYSLSPSTSSLVS